MLPKFMSAQRYFLRNAGLHSEFWSKVLLCRGAFCSVLRTISGVIRKIAASLCRRKYSGGYRTSLYRNLVEAQRNIEIAHSSGLVHRPE